MKLFLRLLAVIALVLTGIVIYVEFAGPGTFDAPYPSITASKDPEVIAHGKYLVYGPAHCATCHVPQDRLTDAENGVEVPLTGGWELDIPPGTFRAPNLTSDEVTGIGQLTDAEIARTLRYGVGSDGRYIMPFMPFQDMSDEDLTAIISYLRTLQPVKQEIRRSELSFLGKALLTFGLVKPEFPKVTPPRSVKRDTTAGYGEYFCNSVANCRGCHTERDMKSGVFTGDPYAGGMQFGPDQHTRDHIFVSPNLTNDRSTGVLAAWNEEVFFTRFRAGRMPENSPLHYSPMPWGAFSRMDENDLKAVYRYISGLPGKPHSIPQTVYLPGEAVPEPGS